MEQSTITLESTNVRTRNLYFLYFFRTCLKEKMLHTAFFERYSQAVLEDVIADLQGTVIASGREDYEENILIRMESGLVAIQYGMVSKMFSVSVASSGRSLLDILTTRLKLLIPLDTPQDPALVPVNFWSLGREGPVVRRRLIEAPGWDEISANYSSVTRDALSRILSIRPGQGGKLLLFHGKPGTGKTYMIRSLLRSWKDWCVAHYIVDMEEFFGRASYMMNVLLDDGDELKWHIYVMEDADEFLGIDAKTNKGQAMSRLLNLVEGMLGQGLRVLVLLSTNEEITKFHPAVLRRGRCLANIEFLPFTSEEAVQWYLKHGLTERAETHGGSILLNNLYGALDERQITTRR